MGKRPKLTPEEAQVLDKIFPIEVYGNRDYPDPYCRHSDACFRKADHAGPHLTYKQNEAGDRWILCGMWGDDDPATEQIDPAKP